MHILKVDQIKYYSTKINIFIFPEMDVPDGLSLKIRYVKAKDIYDFCDYKTKNYKSKWLSRIVKVPRVKAYHVTFEDEVYISLDSAAHLMCRKKDLRFGPKTMVIMNYDRGIYDDKHNASDRLCNITNYQIDEAHLMSFINLVKCDSTLKTITNELGKINKLQHRNIMELVDSVYSSKVLIFDLFENDILLDFLGTYIKNTDKKLGLSSKASMIIAFRTCFFDEVLPECLYNKKYNGKDFEDILKKIYVKLFGKEKLFELML